MKLPCSEPASSPARLPNQLIGFWLVLQYVKRFLNEAFHIVAEFSGFILCESFQGILIVWYARCTAYKAILNPVCASKTKRAPDE
jgi:hypothetical protein